MLKKYTTGYMPMSELVFLIYGIAPAMPIIGIQKWSPHYKARQTSHKPPARCQDSYDDSGMFLVRGGLLVT